MLKTAKILANVATPAGGISVTCATVVASPVPGVAVAFTNTISVGVRLVLWAVQQDDCDGLALQTSWNSGKVQ